MTHRVESQSCTVAVRHGLAGLRQRSAEILLTTGFVLSAYPVARCGISEGNLAMTLIFQVLMVCIVGIREIAAVLLGCNAVTPGEAPVMTRTRSMMVIAAFTASILGAAWGISWLSLSDAARMILLLGVATILRAALRRLSRPCPCSTCTAG